MNWTAVLAEAMEQSMKILTVNPVYHIEKESGSDEFTADFIQGFALPKQRVILSLR